jgi:hypothetical protein
MNDAPTYQCYLGTVGWDHPEWQGLFYPEELPTEWRLAFYNNTFDCVYIPYAQWSEVEPDVIESWMDETQDRFRFILELDNHVPSDSEKERIGAFAGKLALLDDGREIQDRSRLIWVDANPDLKQLSQIIQSGITEGYIVYMVSRSRDLATLEQVRTLMEILGL